MNDDPLDSLAQLETELWQAADNLRANSGLASSEYCMPVLGVIFLRHAANRYEAATRQIQEDQAAGRMPRRQAIKADYLKRRALMLPEKARYGYLLALPKDTNLGQALVQAMNAIEEEFPPLQDNLPKDYTRFERPVLEDLLRVFNSEALRTAGGDVFGRIYEYFLMKFAMQGAQDNGEFFTPPSLVQTIVNVIEPDHGKILDPACGSGGMFVQTSHFIERRGQDTARRVTFYGQEKTRTTIPLARMNLAVHGLEGDIRDANTYYEDAHTLAGKCDFVMANPPFNVDEVDAERVKDDKRLPFGLPGVNKSKKVSNGNYLWISFFYSYLNERGRAGFVMSSQASSAGHGEKEVRRKIVETGAVDAMISIRSNFFYTRTVPCELWFFDRGKPAERRDKVLMLDARNVYRKVSRKINDFSREQLANLSAIVWLYRGQSERFLGLVSEYLAAVVKESAAIADKLQPFEEALKALQVRLDSYFLSGGRKPPESTESRGADAPRSDACATSPSGGRQPPESAESRGADAPRSECLSSDALTELREAAESCADDQSQLLRQLDGFRKKHAETTATNREQHTARKAFEPIAERLRGLVKQVDLVYKLAARAVDAADDGETFDRRAAARQLKLLDAARKDAVEQLKRTAYFHKQVVWLQDRFPEAKLRDVPGLVKLVDRQEIEAADWSLTPGRYLGVAPPEEDDDFDFEATLRDIHTELAGLNEEAAELAKKIQANFEELGI